jgi:hypothetical protein
MKVGTIPLVIPIRDPIERAAPRRKPETELPEGFPGQAEIVSGAEYLAARGIVADAAVQAERFRNWHQARDTRARCWQATWRTWLSKTRPDATTDRAAGRQTAYQEKLSAIDRAMIEACGGRPGEQIFNDPDTIEGVSTYRGGSHG